MKNKRIKLIIILAIPVFILTGFCFWWAVRLNNNLETESTTIISINYSSVLFNEAVSKFPVSQAENNNVVGLISPHHDLAANYTAELFQKIGKRNIKTVIVVGPNHTNSGNGNIITGLVTYNFLNNDISSDTNLVNKIVQDKMATLDVNRLNTEHSIYNIIPYINYYFPKAKIVPIILSGRVTETQAKQLGEYLANYLNEETIIVGSVDFSHYLTTEQASVNDAVSQSAMLNRDYQKIYSLNNDYLDSPATLVAVLTATEEIEANELSMVRHANMSDAIGSGSVANSTSYFTILFSR